MAQVSVFDEVDALAREYQESATAEASYTDQLKAVEVELDAVLQQHAPELYAKRGDLKNGLAEVKKKAEAQKENLVTALSAIAVDTDDPYGDGKLWPHAIVEQKWYVKADLHYASEIAAWLYSLGYDDCIQFKFSPIDRFKSIPAALLPHGLQVITAPNVKIHNIQRWSKPDAE